MLLKGGETAVEKELDTQDKFSRKRLLTWKMYITRKLQKVKIKIFFIIIEVTTDVINRTP